MTNLLQKINFKKWGVLSFLIFFIFTPILVKVRIWDGVYIEPFMPLLVLGFVLIIFSFFKKVGRLALSPELKSFLLPNKIVSSYYLLMAVLFVSYFYGWALTGNPSSDDFLHLIKFTLYFLPFPLAIYIGRILGPNLTRRIFQFMILAGVITALASLFRIWEFTHSGASIDFWVYDIRNRSVGFLSQFIDLGNGTIGFTGKAAHATYGLYVSIVLAVCLALITTVKRFSTRWFGYFAASSIIFYAGILYTLSRGAIVSGFAVFGAWFVWLLKERMVKTLSFFAATLVMVSLVLIQLNPQVYSKFFSTISIQDDVTKPDSTSTSVIVDASTMGRFERWGKIFEFFGENPKFAVFGVGYNQKNLEKFTGVSLTHSLFLDLWARGGLAALGLVLAIWGLLFKKIFDFLRSRSRDIQVFGFVLGGFLAGWFLDNFISGEQFFSDAPMIAFWGVLGLTIALSELRSNNSEVTKILIALTSSGPGGAPKVVYDLLKQVRVKGLGFRGQGDNKFEFVVAAPAGGEFVSRFKGLGYRVYRVPLDKIGVKGFTQLLKIARREKVDLINSHGKGAGLYARKVGFILNVPVVQTFHGLHYSRKNPLARFLYLWLERFLFLFTRLVINVSAGQQREGLAMKIFPKSNSRVVVNGVDTTVVDRVKIDKTAFRRRLGLGPNDFVSTMIARFDPVKGHERLVKLLPDILKNIPNLKIVFAGDGERRSGTERLAKNLGVFSAVRFLGQRSDVFKIFKVSDAAILPSYHEGMPLTVLEAMACHLPVVGSDVVGIRDLVQDGENGYLVDFDNKIEVIKTFRKLVQSPQLRRRMGERGRRLVEEKFSMEKFVKNTLAVYKEALN